MASKAQLRKEAKAAIKKHAKKKPAKKKPAAKRRPVQVGNGKKKIDGQALIKDIESGMHQADILKKYSFKSPTELKAHYLDSLMAQGKTPELKPRRRKPAPRKAAGIPDLVPAAKKAPRKSSGFADRMKNSEYHQFSDGSGGHRPKEGFKPTRPAKPPAAGNAGRQARLREKRKKVGLVQLACYVHRKTRLMVKQEALSTGQTTGQVIEKLILKGLLGDYVTNNSVTNNAKSANKSKKAAPKKSANKRGSAPAKG